MVIFFMRCDGDVLFSTTMRYRLFLDISYHRHHCDYFPKSLGSIILRCLYNFEVFEGFRKFLFFFSVVLEVLGGFLRGLGGFGGFLRGL